VGTSWEIVCMCPLPWWKRMLLRQRIENQMGLPDAYDRQMHTRITIAEGGSADE